MKTQYIIITVFAIALLLVGCTKINLKSQTTDLSEVVDFTDPLLAKPRPEEAISFVNLNNNKWSGVNFRLMCITNVSYNPMFEAKIDAENELLSNQFQRAEKVKKFYADVNKILSDISIQTVGRDYSSVYFPIAKELNRLSQSNSTKKILLIYSDLMENTDEMSFYTKENINLLKSNPEVIRKYFENSVSLENLSGINIYIIFQPNGISEDEQFKLASKFYKDLFESKGATVEITASVNL